MTRLPPDHSFHPPFASALVCLAALFVLVSCATATKRLCWSETTTETTYPDGKVVVQTISKPDTAFFGKLCATVVSLSIPSPAPIAFALVADSAFAQQAGEGVKSLFGGAGRSLGAIDNITTK